MFQIHFWIGAAVGAYILLMGVSGSLLVFHRDFADRSPYSGSSIFMRICWPDPMGRLVNGIGALSLVLLCVTGAVIWWPGINHWRRSLTVDLGARFPRLNWDFHSALGFWGFGFVLMWGVSAVYLVFPRWFDALLLLDPAGPGDRSSPILAVGIAFWPVQPIDQGDLGGLGSCTGGARVHRHLHLLPAGDLRQAVEPQTRYRVRDRSNTTRAIE